MELIMKYTHNGCSDYTIVYITVVTQRLSVSWMLYKPSKNIGECD